MAEDELIENMREKFRAYYAANLQGKFAELETVRENYLWKFGIRCALVVGWFVILFTVLLSGEKSAEEVFSEPVVMITILMFCLLGIWIVRPLSAYKKEAKKAVMDKILRAVMDPHAGGPALLHAGQRIRHTTDMIGVSHPAKAVRIRQGAVIEKSYFGRESL